MHFTFNIFISNFIFLIVNTSPIIDYIVKFILYCGDINPKLAPSVQFNDISARVNNYENDMKILRINCRSSIKKIKSKKLVKTCGLNTIYGFSETWFYDSYDNKLWTLDSDNFVSFRCDRSAFASK